MMRWWPAIGPSLAVLLASIGEARADAVPEPPAHCPAGSVGTTSHTGRWCNPRPCETDAVCKGMEVDGRDVDGRCETTSLCVKKEMVAPHRRVVPADGGALPKIERSIATGVCIAGGSCETGATCETAKRCVPAKANGAEAPLPDRERRARGGCGCSEGSAAPSGALAGVLVVGLALARRRRRRAIPTVHGAKPMMAVHGRRSASRTSSLRLL